MEGAYKDKFSFVGEWYDNQASLIRRFNVFYYPTDDTIEMFDLKNRKTFVRRVKVNGVTLENFFIGSTINILGRLVKIVNFACEDTKQKLHLDMQETFVLIKPLPMNIAGKILNIFQEQGLRIMKMKKTQITADDIHVLFRNLQTDPTFQFLLEYLSGQQVYGLELIGKDAVQVCLKIVGDQDPSKAEPGTIRALYGTDAVRNCVHSSPDADAAVQNLASIIWRDVVPCPSILVSKSPEAENNNLVSADIEYFFSPSSMRLRLTATLSNCTLCVVKPHAVREGKLGPIWESIDEGGFDVTALNMFFVENVNAAEFYEVYKGIVQEYKGMVDELSSGPCVAMEIVAKDKNLNTAVEFRKLVGPSDPEIARLLRPYTLRAKFGKTKVQNAIHCSDLAEDGLLEVEYFFKILEL